MPGREIDSYKSALRWVKNQIEVFELSHMLG